MNNLYVPFQPTLTDIGLKHLGLTLTRIPASTALSGAVDCYLQINATRPTLYPIIPDGMQAVFMSPAGSILNTARSTASALHIPAAGEYFGIWFKPGGLRHFVSADMAEFKDQFVGADLFLWRGLVSLHETIYRYAGFLERAAVCEQWLLTRYNKLRPNPFDHALRLIYQSCGNTRISRLSDSIGWSSRHLNRVFRQHTGLSTIQFAQIVRMQNACKQLFVAGSHSSNTVDDLGFFDQSHLIKDWRKLLRASPGEFWKRFPSDFYNN